jgi:predicted nucleic acid-binding protein
MAVYADTSLLTAYYCPERGSGQAQAYLTTQNSIAISWLTETEMISVLSKKVREGTLSSQDAWKIITIFQEHIDTGSYEVLLIGVSDYRDANRFIDRFDTGLRTLDALHVAVVLRKNKTLATADIKLAEAAERLGVKVDFIDYAT